MKIDIDAVMEESREIMAEAKEIMMEAVGALLDLICLQDDGKKADDSTARFLRQEFCWDLLDGKYGLAGTLYGLRLMRRKRK